MRTPPLLADFSHARACKPFCENSLTLPLSMIRQGLFYVPFILVLPRLLGVTGIYLTQPAADLLTILVCLCSIRSMKQITSANMNRLPEGD